MTTLSMCSPETPSSARHSPGKLTIKLALWCLAMMAANGDSYIDYSYPAPNSWRRSDDGGNGGEDEDGGGGVDNLTSFSQAGTGVEENPPQELHTGYDKGAVNEDEDEDQDNGDSQTVPPTNTMRKPLLVKVKKHIIKRTLYFADSKGREVETKPSYSIAPAPILSHWNEHKL
ncbi:hypothetical protein NKR19_g10334 [Coniochaeta hoffmannii]|uniref:Uncharacterized protein n=1 Tax=Coniochaeta hoffmannii TaxID=91930 RepID=A0AA38R7H4_9PEZI|nr:hypothetical protein NKR19_g10334 [Coniochaeta hoffmannii]